MYDKKNVLIPLIRSAVGARELASFPVELVYVETPEKTAPTSGKMHVELPKLNTPAMHVMANYYAPAEGKYGRPGGLFAAPKGGFTGTLRPVKGIHQHVGRPWRKGRRTQCRKTGTENATTL